MRAKLLMLVSLALWASVLPVAHAMPIHADGSSGLSDSADFDDLIVSGRSIHNGPVRSSATGLRGKTSFKPIGR
jgi:hypothetical protein